MSTESAPEDPTPTMLENGEKPNNDSPPSEPTSEQTPTKPLGQKPLEERSKGKIALIMLSLGIAVFLAALDTTIITTALETISDHFHSDAGFTWIGSSYLLASTASTPLWGKISDIFGRKPILLMANFVFFVGSLISALSVNIGMLLTGRAIQGLGAGGLLTLCNICIGDLFSPRRRGAYYGIIGGVWALAAALGPIMGGVFTEKVSWRWCFYINLPLDGLAFFIILVFLDLRTPKTPLFKGLAAIDWLGSFLIVSGTLIFLFGLEYGGTTFPWSSATVICLLVFGFLACILFVPVQVKFAKYPLMPGHIFANRSNMASLGVCFFHGMTFIGGSFYLPLYFQAVRSASPLHSGVLTLAYALSLALGSMVTGIFIRKTGQYLPPIIFGLSVMTLGFGLFTNFTADSSIAKIALYQIVAGLGTGPNFQAPLIALQGNIHPRDIATATATFAFTRTLASAISVVVGGVIFQNELSSRGIDSSGSGGALASVGQLKHEPPAQRKHTQQIYASSLQTMWIFYVCMAAAGLATSLLIRRKPLSKDHTETKTGLAAQEEGRLAQKQEAAEKKALKHGGGGKVADEN